MRTTRLALIALAPLAALLTVACGTTAAAPGAAYNTSTASPTTATTASAANASKTVTKATLTVRKTSLGYVLATSTGMTVYWYSDDVKNSGKSDCTDGCLAAWPAVTGTPKAPAGVALIGKLGTITRPGGVIQATYDGYPLYTYANDMAPGQTTGNGVGGVWHVFSGATLAKSLVTSAKAPASGKSAAPGATASSTSGGGSW
jgi:predicted lipoprotein with Yx(FWY)xxD motif